MTPTVQSLVDKAAKYDPSLAAEIREFAQSREYGLVFEHNRPERMRLYGKPVRPGDAVQVLPERGKQSRRTTRCVGRLKASTTIKRT